MNLEELLWVEQNHEREQHKVRVEVGLRLAKERKRRGLSYRQLSALTGEDISGLSKLEKAKWWSRPMAERLAKFYQTHEAS